MRRQPKYLNKRLEELRFRRIWKRLAVLLSCIVVIVTVGALVLPGVTVTTDDQGPDSVPVSYFVYIDGKWQKVGSTQKGWRLTYEDRNYGGSGPNGGYMRDYITVAHVQSVFGPYGFNPNVANPAKYIAYQKLDASGNKKTGAWSDTATVRLETGTNLGVVPIIPLSQDAPGGYNLYFIPGNAEGKVSFTNTGKDESAIPLTGSQFFSISVSDPNGHVYKNAADSPKAYVRQGAAGSLTVKQTPAGWKGSWNSYTASADGETLTFHYNAVVSAQVVTPRDFFYDDTSLRVNSGTAKPGDLQTVTGDGFRFEVFNYSSDINDYLHQLGLVNELNTTEGNYFSFRHTGKDWDYSEADITYDKDGFYHYQDAEGNYYPDHATVKWGLDAEGYPRLDLTHHGYLTLDAAAAKVDGTSLSALFGKDANIPGYAYSQYVQAYQAENTPLVKDGNWYRYTSQSNAASFNTIDNRWYVRGYPERGQTTATSYPSYHDFLPFNATSDTYTAANGQTYQYAEKDIDYWFGMRMKINFYQAADGLTGAMDANNDPENMIFRFSGDDDVWVFLNGVLVLDIGGTHGAVQGTINYHTGLVEAYIDFQNNNGVTGTGEQQLKYYSTTLYECYKAALMENGMDSDQVQALLDDIFVKATDVKGQSVTHDQKGNEYDIYRFKDFTLHELDFFYLERGAAAANCTIELNMPTLPNESLTVGKDLDFGSGDLTPEQIAFAQENLVYWFRVVDEKGNPIITQRNTPGGTMDLLGPDYQNTGQLVQIRPDGWFGLKAGQRVMFEDMPKFLSDAGVDHYYVQEAIPRDYADQYHAVVYRASGTTGESHVEGEDGGEDFFLYKTSPLEGDKTYRVLYTNKVNIENMSFLRITKQVLDGSVYAPGTKFPVQVLLGGSPVGRDVPFRLEDGTILYADANGCIYLSHGQTAVLNYPLIAGTQFAVKELLPGGWVLDSYGVTNAKVLSNTTAEGVTGEIPVNNTAAVTIYNKTYSFDVKLPITKLWQGSNAGAAIQRSATFRATQVQDLYGNPYTGEAVPETIPDMTIYTKGSGPGENVLVIGYQSGVPGGTYYYRITEVSCAPGPGEMSIPDGSAYVVEVQVTEDSARIVNIYRDGSPVSQIQFVNVLGTAQLPATGGAGALLYILSGWILASFAVLTVIYQFYKSRKGVK